MWLEPGYSFPKTAVFAPGEKVGMSAYLRFLPEEPLVETGCLYIALMIKYGGRLTRYVKSVLF